ncbi:NADP-specific glutamate dehydrogenase [Wenzhouxiangella sp. XN79A]|uniref:NADP-specific glutamate dehydrogenase n=1 Tax=Wenzhouxiangella sp. XN79A TaxID=2724193 RepID=UPI00144AC90C|nr:NADP-specific glutamate dehydrogenase [Wenzhouxiangella sp. XN79A]NKI36037.1 NADP-specific glutamate dehydrogenase [Wenzhouxiangella sp. XN79A]
MSEPHAAQSSALNDFMDGLVRRNPGQDEFHQAVHEVACDLLPFIAEHEKYRDAMLLERMTEPDRIVSFRVCWTDDDNCVQVNRGWRVQFNNAIGPYKGGLRFDPEVTESVLKFLGFEQCFKNALTGLPIGGAKGGANFDPKQHSDTEIMRFCQALMNTLVHYVGPNQDIPAGDIGVGQREIGYLFGQYRSLTREFVGALTGKGVSFGGSELRTEATGFGVLYFVKDMAERLDRDLDGARVAISGAGNVACHAARKAIELGAKVVTLSDSKGMMHGRDGLDAEQLATAQRMKGEHRCSIEQVADELGWRYHEGAKPWGVECDIALPCATQNELDGDDAKRLLDNGCWLVAEGANMPCTAEAVEAFQQDDAMSYAPGKAANAGGVAVSGLERAQNAQHLVWTRDRVDEELQRIMREIHDRCVRHGGNGDGRPVNYRKGANIAGFEKLADAMLAQGVL